MAKIRDPKETDQSEAEKAILLFEKLRDENPKIEDAVWISVLWSVVVASFISSGLSHSQFSEELDNVKKHYKKFFYK